jgi:hypothetical protein
MQRIKVGDRVKQISTGTCGKVINIEKSKADGSLSFGVITDAGHYMVFTQSNVGKEQHENY